jgi:RNA polymerase sigma-70 factor (ECF subfamily)
VPAATRPSLRLVTPPRRAKQLSEPSGSGWDDHELVAAVRDGDEVAAGAFHDRLRPRVEGTVLRLLGPGDHDTEDLAQLAMISLIESIDRYRGECSLESWASTITAHVVFNHIRRRRLERRVFAPPPEGELPGRLNAGRALAARDLLRCARDLLGKISSEKAWTFLLHDVCGFDLREIASITGVTVAAAQGRLVRGRREIHELAAADPELSQALLDLEDGR